MSYSLNFLEGLYTGFYRGWGKLGGFHVGSGSVTMCMVPVTRGCNPLGSIPPPVYANYRSACEKGIQVLNPTLPETNMETQKRPYSDYSPFKQGLCGFPC